MRKILFLFMLLSCMISCKDNNTPSDPGENILADLYSPTFLPSKEVSYRVYADGTKYRTITEYQYNANNDLVKLSLYQNNRLVNEHNYIWDGNVRIGTGVSYNFENAVSAHFYDTTYYVDKEHTYYSRLALRQEFADTSFYSVEEYTYAGSKQYLMEHKHYDNNQLDLYCYFTHSFGKRYGAIRDIPNSMYIYWADTLDYYMRDLPSRHIVWTKTEDRTSMADWSYRYKDYATLENQLSEYFFQSYDFYNDGNVFFTGTHMKYKWSGDSIRFGEGGSYVNDHLDYSIADTTYYLIILTK